jgi:hypothetical protein
MKKMNVNLNFTMISVIIAAFLMVSTVSCSKSEQKQDVTQVEQKSCIGEQEVADIQKSWGEGIVKIGKVYVEKGDFKAAATEHINMFYNYQEGTVLFKPTLASEKQFRTDFQGALSYFVGGNESYHEDHGFAIKPWSAVRWENVGTKIFGDVAIAMGNYFFTPAKGGDDVKVEYSFVYKKDKEGKLKIVLHGSHLPYVPAEKH